MLIRVVLPAACKGVVRGSVPAGRAENRSATVLANGLIYCRNSDGDLVCVDAR